MHLKRSYHFDPTRTETDTAQTAEKSVCSESYMNNVLGLINKTSNTFGFIGQVCRCLLPQMRRLRQLGRVWLMIPTNEINPEYAVEVRAAMLPTYS